MNEPWCVSVLGYGRGVFAVSPLCLRWPHDLNSDTDVLSLAGHQTDRAVRRAIRIPSLGCEFSNLVKLSSVAVTDH